MSIQSMPDRSTTTERVSEFISNYAVVVYPLLAGIALILIGYGFDVLGRGVEAGVTAATGILIIAMTLVIYAMFWALGRFGH